MKFHRFIYVIILILFAACSQPKKYISDPAKQLVQEFSNRRVVMLADFSHDFALPYKSLIGVLSAWVQMNQDPSYDQRNLTLFLEEDDQIAGLIREYIKTGNLDPFLNFVLPSTSLERLEFYADLRRISQHIDSLNVTLPASKRVTFDVQGPEPTNSFDSMVMDSSRESGISYFINQRDSLTSIRAITYLKAHPDRKALFFYGTAHLIKNTVSKNVGGDIPPEKSVGNYLAFYLKKEFGDNAVLSVNQLSRSRMSRFLSDAPEGTILMYSENVSWNTQFSSDNNLNPANFDSFILRNELLCPNHPLNQIFSTRTLDAAIRRLEQLNSHRSGAFGSKFYDQALQSLKFISGNSYTSVEQWKSWNGSKSFDPIQQLSSDRFRKQLSAYYTENSRRPEKMNYLISLGSSQPLADHEWNSLFKEIIPQTVFLNCIGISIIGSRNERESANKYLIEFSGKNFQEPDRYLKWWRENYYRASY